MFCVSSSGKYTMLKMRSQDFEELFFKISRNKFLFYFFLLHLRWFPVAVVIGITFISKRCY